MKLEKSQKYLCWNDYLHRIVKIKFISAPNILEDPVFLITYILHWNLSCDWALPFGNFIAVNKQNKKLFIPLKIAVGSNKLFTVIAEVIFRKKKTNNTVADDTSPGHMRLHVKRVGVCKWPVPNINPFSP